LCSPPKWRRAHVSHAVQHCVVRQPPNPQHIASVPQAAATMRAHTHQHTVKLPTRKFLFTIPRATPQQATTLPVRVRTSANKYADMVARCNMNAVTIVGVVVQSMWCAAKAHTTGALRTHTHTHTHTHGNTPPHTWQHDKR